MKRKFLGFLIILLSIACVDKNERPIKLNDIQVIGSHNSYKKAIEEPLWDYLYDKDSVKAKSLQYEHVSIEKQLDLGLRSLELDVFYDPKGGRFSNPKGLGIVGALWGTPLKYDKNHKLEHPGLKMFHIQDIDFRSHHLLFKDCLKEIKSWSDKNKAHMPVVVLINAKDRKIEGLKNPLSFTKEALRSIGQEILSVFNQEDLITSDFVRGTFKTLEKAILTGGWSELSKVKGKFLFVLDENKEKTNRYLDEHGNLQDRVMFVNVKEGSSGAAFGIINNPVENFEYINQLVSKGYMVRTRADDGIKESRSNDYNTFEKQNNLGHK